MIIMSIPGFYCPSQYMEVCWHPYIWHSLHLFQFYHHKNSRLQRQIKHTLSHSHILPVHNNLRLGRYPVTSTSSSVFTTSSDSRFRFTFNNDFRESTIGSLSTAAMTATVNKSSSQYVIDLTEMSVTRYFEKIRVL